MMAIPKNPSDWELEYWEFNSIGMGSLYATDSGGDGDPRVIKSRSIGFLSNIDDKPRFRVKANYRKILAKKA